MQKWPAHRNLWPTPTAQDAAVKWPTPSASDALGGPMNPQDRLDQGHTLNLKEAVWTGGEGGGSLNPTFVEYLMGFPRDWTAI
jgi:hypothetical protein